MTYKIIFSDIDGTLLNQERELSPLTRSVFRELQKTVPIVLISSRMPQAMTHLQHQLGISHQPLICYNGALIIVDDQVISSTEIPVPVIEDLQRFNQRIGCHISMYHKDEWYAPQWDRWAKREENNTKVTPLIRSYRKVLDQWREKKKGAHKLMCMGPEEDIDLLFEFLMNQYATQLHLYRSKPTYIEIASKQISKLSAINTLLDDHFHLELNEAIAFGDNFNDFEMLRAVGMGIAVGNAKPEILEIAKEITFHGKEDGVAKSLQKLFRLT